MVQIQPDIVKMTKLFGMGTSIFFDVRHLVEFNPWMQKKLSIQDDEFSNFQKIIALNVCKFGLQDLYNLYFISIRIKEKRSVNGKVSIVNGRFIAEHDAEMRNSIIEFQNDDLMVMKKGKGRKSNPSGSRYHVFKELSGILVPWFVEELKLKQNKSRYLFIILMIYSGYDDLKVYFEDWKLRTKEEEAKYEPYTYPISIKFLKHFERNLKPKDDAKRLKQFLRAYKKNPSLYVNDKIVPPFIKENLLILEISSRQFLSEEIEKIKNSYKRFETKFKEEGIWPS
jgi:hypothetical protein